MGRTVAPVQEPTVSRALGAGVRAVAGETWVVALGLCVSVLRGILALPASAFVFAASWLAVRRTLLGGGRANDVLETLAHLWVSPRFRSIAIGLWLAGALLWGALRVAWVAGAVPLLAWHLSGRRTGKPGFAEGAAWRFHRVLPVAVAAVLLDLLSRAMVLAAALGILAVGSRVQGGPAAGAAAFVAAFALVCALFLATSVSAVGDVAVARSAMAGESVGTALLAGIRSFLDRPAAFLVAVLAVWIATVFATGSAQGLFGALGGMARGGPRLLLFFPELAVAVLGALVAAAAELWRLSALGVLALAGQSGRETRPMSLRSESLGILPPSQ